MLFFDLFVWSLSIATTTTCYSRAFTATTTTVPTTARFHEDDYRPLLFRQRRRRRRLVEPVGNNNQVQRSHGFLGTRVPLRKTKTTTSRYAETAGAVVVSDSDGKEQPPPQQADKLDSSGGGGSDGSLPGDSLEAFERDVATVLKTLRASEQDVSLPRLFRMTDTRRLPTFSKTWTLEDWERHSSRVRYIDYLRTLPFDRLVMRLWPPMLILTAWSVAAVKLCSVVGFGGSAAAATAVTATSGHWLWQRALGATGALLSRAALPLTTLSLVSTFVAALLTLRSNQGLSRLNEGRVAFGKVVLYTRDAAQMVSAWIYPTHPELGLRLARHMALFPWLLKKFLRGTHVNGTDEDIIRTMLSPEDAEYVLRQRKEPVAVVTRLRQVVGYLGHRHELSTAEELDLDHNAQALNHCVMTTERIRASPIPPMYTAHTGRYLLFYLFFLPLALANSGALNMTGTVITTVAVGYAMMGLDEISHLLEEPFKLMPLYQLSKNAMTDVADAFCCPPPPLFPEDERDNPKQRKDATNYQPPAYR